MPRREGGYQLPLWPISFFRLWGNRSHSGYRLIYPHSEWCYDRLSHIQKRTLVTAFVIAAVISLGGVRFGYLIQSPDVYFLTDTADAQWIKYDTEFELLSKRPERLMVEFRHRFEIHKPVEGAQFTVQAMKHCSVFLDGKTLFTHPYDSNKWKQVHEITIPFTVNPGVHDLVLVITSENSHPAVIAHSETLPIRTGSNGWHPLMVIIGRRLLWLRLCVFPKSQTSSRKQQRVS